MTSVSVELGEEAAVADQAAAVARHRREHMPQDLRYVVKDGCAWAGMMGFGEHLFPMMAFALALGERASARTMFIPMLLGSTLQLTTPWIVQWLGSHKRTVLLGTGTQVACFVPLATACALRAAGVVGPQWTPAWLVLAVLSVYQFGALCAGAAWATWVSTIVPLRARGGYFSMRTRWIYGVQLSALLCTTGIMAVAKPNGDSGVLWGFALCMLLAGGFRSLSLVMEMRTTEPVPVPHGHRRVGLLEITWKLSHGPSAGLVGCFLLMALGRAIAEPRLLPMAMGPLDAAATTTTLVIGAALLGRLGAFFLLPGLLRRWGGPRTLRAAGIALVPLFLIPALLPSITTVLVMHVLLGVVLGCWEMTTWLQVLEHTPASERTGYVSLLYFGTWVATSIGGLVGEWLLGMYRLPEVMPPAYELDGYRVVFVVSCVARAAMVVPLIFWVRRVTRAKQ